MQRGFQSFNCFAYQILQMFNLFCCNLANDFWGFSGHYLFCGSLHKFSLKKTCFSDSLGLGPVSSAIVFDVLCFMKC